MQEKIIYFKYMVFGKLLWTRSVSDFGVYQIDYRLSVSNLKTQNAPKSELVFFFPPPPPFFPPVPLSHSSLFSFFCAGNQADDLTHAEQVLYL